MQTNAVEEQQHAGNSYDGHDDSDEPPVDLQPKFTDQDEQRELATLNINELMKLQSDLTGIQTITNGMTGLGVGGVGSGGVNLNVYNGDTSPLANLTTHDHMRLAALDQHMGTLPTESTAAYFKATTVCPDEVSKERKLLFLQCEEGNIQLAALRLALYWQFRLDNFGEDRCFLPMTLAGAMRDEVMSMAKARVLQLLPNTDAAGRAIIYFCFGNRDWAKFSLRQEMMTFTYLLEVILQKANIRNRGFVLIANGKDSARKHFSKKWSHYMQITLDSAFPIRVRSVHVCNGSPIMNYIIYPVVQRLMPTNIRLRAKLHRGSGQDILRRLAEFNLPRERVPSDIGGSVVLDVNQFLIDRISIESANAEVQLSSPQVEEGTTSKSAKRQRKEGDNKTNNDAPGGATKGKSKRTGSRNIIDPRMAKAVLAKKKCPDLPLTDALLAGGFEFDIKAGQTEKDIKDDEGISLKQVSRLESRREWFHLFNFLYLYLIFDEHHRLIFFPRSFPIHSARIISADDFEWKSKRKRRRKGHCRFCTTIHLMKKFWICLA